MNFIFQYLEAMKSLLCASFLAQEAFCYREDGPFKVVANINTKGAAGWTHFNIDGQDYLSVANFFTSNPARKPNMETKSVVYRVKSYNQTSLKLKKVQELDSVGAHGVITWEVESSYKEFYKDKRTGKNKVAREVPVKDHFLAIPNYYGGYTGIYKFDSTKKKFKQFQMLQSDGGGAVDVFDLETSRGTFKILAITQFNVGLISLFQCGPGVISKFQDVRTTDSVGTTSTLKIKNKKGEFDYYLIGSAYNIRGSWQTRSPVYKFDYDLDQFVKHHDVSTIGAHDVETLSVKDKTGKDRHFAFFSNDKDGTTTKLESELFEWDYKEEKFFSVEKVRSDGAHGAEFFKDATGRYFLAVAELGDRDTDKYRRNSNVYQFNPERAELTRFQYLRTKGATDFEAFTLGNITYLAVSNEQDDKMGGDIKSQIWALDLPPQEEDDDDQEEEL